MNKVLEDLSHCGEMGSLKAELRALCSSSWPVARLEGLPMVGASRISENVYLVVDLGMPA